MSSMRNAVARRPHKERSQPESRQKWGLLEKHKDYSLRAKDYNQKKQKLNILQQKTKERHPDEFAFGMLSAGSAKQGKHGQRGEDNRLSHDAVKLLKTQDSGYLRNVAQRTRRELEKAEQEVGMDGVLRRWESKKKIVFEDDEPESKRRKLEEEDEDKSEDDDDVVDNVATSIIVSNSETKPAAKVLSRKQAQKEKDKLAQLKVDRKRRKRLQELRNAKLELLRKRQKDIMAAADQLELQRAKMSKVIGGTNKNGVKFKIRERKR